MTKPACSVPDCEGRHHARGWCKKHYQRWRRHGDPEATNNPRERVDQYLDEVRWLLGQGEAPERAAQRVGVTAAAIARSAYRRGDHELAAPFARIQKRDRKSENDMTTREKAMPDVRDPAKWVDNCPECLCRNNPPHIVEIGTYPGSIRCHYTCQECRGTWRTEYAEGVE